MKVVNDNVQYAKLVVRVGMRTNTKSHDLSDILGDDAVESAVRSCAVLGVLYTYSSLPSLSRRLSHRPITTHR